MTIKAFAAKYGITMSLATKAAAITAHTATEERDFDYLEKDLYRSLMRIYKDRITKSDRKTWEIIQKAEEVKYIAHSSGVFT